MSSSAKYFAMQIATLKAIQAVQVRDKIDSCDAELRKIAGQRQKVTA